MGIKQVAIAGAVMASVAGIASPAVAVPTPGQLQRPGCQVIDLTGSRSCTFSAATGFVTARGVARSFTVFANGRACSGGGAATEVCHTKRGATIRVVVSHGVASATG